MLVDDTTRKLLEHPFNLDNEDKRWDIYYKFFHRHCVQQFCWLADQCAEELIRNKTFDPYSFFVCNIGFLWECFSVLPNEFKEAFKEFGDAIYKAAKKVEQTFTQ